MSGDTVPVHVGPRADGALEDAVRAGGGRPVALEDAAAIVYHGSDEPQEVVDMLRPGVRWVQLPHAGVEPWTAARLVTRDPVWTSAAGAYAPQVAEHGLALMLAAARDLHTSARARTWSGRSTRLFAGSTVALIGAGGIGRALIDLLAPLDCRILAVSDSGPVDGAALTVGRAAFRDVLPAADFVVLLAPTTAATRGMIGTEELALMREGAWLVNLARGALVVTDDLVDALRAHRIGGAALDVTDPEPLPDGHPLWTLDNVLVTPHAANPEAAQWRSLTERVRENVRRFAADEPLLGVIDPDAGF